MTPYIFLWHTPYGPQVRRFSNRSQFRTYCGDMSLQHRRVQRFGEFLAAGLDRGVQA